MSIPYIVSTKYDGKLRKLYSQFCICGEEYLIPNHKLKKTTYCSPKCSHDARKTTTKVACAQCGNTLERTAYKIKTSKHKMHFCNRKCKELAQSFNGDCPEIRPSHYKDGRHVYRKHVVFDKCVECNDNRKFILVVHHKDGNRGNNKPSNLEVVCPNCHAIRHLKYTRGTWIFHFKSLTPRDKIKELTVGFGTAWGGHLTCNENSSGVQIPGGPPHI